MHSLKTNFVMEGEIRKQNQLKEDNWKKKRKEDGTILLFTKICLFDFLPCVKLI